MGKHTSRLSAKAIGDHLQRYGHQNILTHDHLLLSDFRHGPDRPRSHQNLALQNFQVEQKLAPHLGSQKEGAYL